MQPTLEQLSLAHQCKYENEVYLSYVCCVSGSNTGSFIKERLMGQIKLAGGSIAKRSDCDNATFDACSTDNVSCRMSET